MNTSSNISDKSYMFEYISHIYELFPEPDIKLYEFYEWIELIMSHYGKAEVALNISKKLHKLYVNEYGSPNFRTARMLCRIGCSEKNMLIKENLEHLNEGLKMLNEIENLSYHEKLYISDVHVVLINSYMLEYDKSKDTKFLNLAQKSCEEIIKIRSAYKKNYNSFRMSLISAYCCLSRIEIISGNYQEADKFIKKAEKEYESNKISSLKFYIEYAKVELLIAQNKIDEVIDLLKNILSNQKSYFNSKQSDSGVDIIKLGILLGDLYNKKGESKLAKIYYNDMLELARDTPYYDEILIKLQ